MALLEILTTALCLIDNESNTARRFISHKDSAQRVSWTQHQICFERLILMILVGIDVAKDKHDCLIQTADFRFQSALNQSIS